MKNENIRKMTKEDFASIPENQKTFYQGLLDSGQLIITSKELESDSEEKKILYSSDCVVDRPVRIHFMNRQDPVVGIFVRSWQYDILVIKDGLSLVIPKHSVSCIEEIEEVKVT